MCGVPGAAVTGVLLQVSRDNRLPRKDKTAERTERKMCPVSHIKGKQAFSHVEL